MSGKWAALQEEYIKDYTETGISIHKWCVKKGLKYATARRYIKINDVKANVTPKVVVYEKPKNLKHGGYSQYFTKTISTMVSETSLNHELDLCRSRIHLVVCTIEEIQKRLGNDKVDVEVAASLYESLFKADLALDRNIARVESITKTLSSLRLDNLQERKIVADTLRSSAQSKAAIVNTVKSAEQVDLIRLQIKLAERSLGSSSKVDDYIDSITGGLDKVVSDAT